MTLPAEGVFHNLVFVSIRKQYPYQAFKVMHGLWGMGQMMFTKYIVVVDEDCDVHNTSEVLFRLCANTDPERDTTIIRIRAIHSITRLPSRTLGLTWALTPRANCRAKIITAPGRNCSRWMSACRRSSIRFGKTRDNCTPNQKRFRLRRASSYHCALESIWYGPQPEHRLSSLCAQRSCTPLPSKRKRTECPLGAQATSLCSASPGTFLEPLEVHRSRPRAIEVQSAYDAND